MFLQDEKTKQKHSANISKYNKRNIQTYDDDFKTAVRHEKMVITRFKHHSDDTISTT